jgi:hypothetical protein
MKNNFSSRNSPDRARIIVRPLVCMLLLPFLAGCPDLTQVQQFAKAADGAKTSITAIASDFKGSCDRQNLYVHLPPGPPPNPPPPQACSSGDDLTKVGNNLVAEQNVLLEYIDTLGTFAGSDASGFEKEAPTLNTSFKTAGLDTTQQAMASAAGTSPSSRQDWQIKSLPKPTWPLFRAARRRPVEGRPILNCWETSRLS